jgi:hypothetical protein
VKGLNKFKNDIKDQVQNLKKVLFIDYKEIKNMFVECQTNLLEEDKFIQGFKKDVSKEIERIKKCEIFMFDQENNANNFTDEYKDTLSKTKLIENKFINSS